MSKHKVNLRGLKSPSPKPKPKTTTELSTVLSWNVEVGDNLPAGRGIYSPKFKLLERVISCEFSLMQRASDDVPLPDKDIYYIIVKMHIDYQSNVDYLCRFRFTVHGVNTSQLDPMDVPIFPQCSSEVDCLDLYASENLLTNWISTINVNSSTLLIDGYQSFAYKFNKLDTETPRYPLFLASSVIQEGDDQFFGAKPKVTIVCELVMNIDLGIKLFEIEEFRNINETYTEAMPKQFIDDENSNLPIVFRNTEDRVHIHEEIAPPEWLPPIAPHFPTKTEKYPDPYVSMRRQANLNKWLVFPAGYKQVLALMRFFYYNLVPMREQKDSILQLLDQSQPRLNELVERLSEVEKQNEFRKTLDQVLESVFRENFEYFEEPDNKKVKVYAFEVARYKLPKNSSSNFPNFYRHFHTNFVLRNYTPVWSNTDDITCPNSPKHSSDVVPKTHSSTSHLRSPDTPSLEYPAVESASSCAQTEAEEASGGECSTKAYRTTSNINVVRFRESIAGTSEVSAKNQDSKKEFIPPKYYIRLEGGGEDIDSPEINANVPSTSF